MSWPTPVGRSCFSASNSSVRFRIAAIASLSVDSIVTTTALPFTADLVVAPNTVLGHMPARCAMVSAAPDPALDPPPAPPAPPPTTAPPPTSAASPDPAAVSAPPEPPDAAPPAADPSAPEPPAPPAPAAPPAVLRATWVMHFVISSEIAPSFFCSSSLVFPGGSLRCSALHFAISAVTWSMHAFSLQAHILSLNAVILAAASSPVFLQPPSATAAPTASDAANSVNAKRISAPRRCYSSATPYQRTAA